MKYPAYLFDLHCDTLTRHKDPKPTDPDILDDPALVVNLSAIPKEVRWGQFYAIFLPDALRGPEAVRFYEYHRDLFYEQTKKFADRITPCRSAEDLDKAWKENKTAAFLTIENGSPLAGDLHRVALLAKDGVRCMTLTWNGENEIASGNDTDHGLSDFGREAVQEMEKEGILVDVSHLNDHGFEDLMGVIKKPFVATHSNARSICRHKRNLTDDQIREMVKRDCLIGLNYYVDFLDDEGKVPGYETILRHIEHFFALGAQRNLALGSDFDGCRLPECLSSPRKAAGLYGYLLERGMSQAQAEDILYKNALRFLDKNLQ